MRYELVKSREESIAYIQEQFEIYGGVSCYDIKDNLSLIGRRHGKRCKCEMCEFKRQERY